MIQVQLITPEKLAFSEEVDFIAAPTPDGEIGILPHHAPLLTRLGAGVLRLKKGNNTHTVAVSGGFLEVQGGSRVSIFSETAEFAEQIDVERARLAAERAKAQLKTPQADLTGAELAQVEAALSRAILRVKVAERSWRKQRPEGIH